MELAPGDAAALNDYATLLIDAGRAHEASDVMLRGLRCSERAGAVVYNYGLLLEQLGEPARAEAAFREAAEKRAAPRAPLAARAPPALTRAACPRARAQ